MPSWILFAFLGPLIWSGCNLLDKVLISRYMKSGAVGALVIFTGLSGFIISAAILIFHPTQLLIHPINALIIALVGALFVAAYIPYYKALAIDDASAVVPFFQFIPVFSYLLGLFFLGERLSLAQIGSSALIILGAIGISLETQGKRLHIKRTLPLMLVSSLALAFCAFVFKKVALDENFWSTVFWEYIGAGGLSLMILCCVKSYRTAFVDVIKQNRAAILGLNGIGEVFNILAKMAANYASLLAPLALVQVINGFQPAFVFIEGALLSVLLPSILKERLDARHVTKKIVAILVMFIGVYFLTAS